MDIYIQHTPVFLPPWLLIQIARIYQPKYIHPTIHKNDSHTLAEQLLHSIVSELSNFPASKFPSFPAPSLHSFLTENNLSGIRYPLFSAISYPISAIRYPLSAISYQLSALTLLTNHWYFITPIRITSDLIASGHSTRPLALWLSGSLTLWLSGSLEVHFTHLQNIISPNRTTSHRFGENTVQAW